MRQFVPSAHNHHLMMMGGGASGVRESSQRITMPPAAAADGAKASGDKYVFAPPGDHFVGLPLLAVCVPF